MIFWRLHDFFEGCMLCFGGEVELIFCVERLPFVDRLHDFLSGEVA